MDDERVSLKEYFDKAIDALDKRLSQRMDGYTREFHEHILAVVRENQLALNASDKAINKSEAAAEKRFDNVNEFRQSLSDQTATFISRREFEASNKALNDKVGLVTDRVNTGEGRTSGADKLGAVIMSIAAIIISIISILVIAFKK